MEKGRFAEEKGSSEISKRAPKKITLVFNRDKTLVTSGKAVGKTEFSGM